LLDEAFGDGFTFDQIDVFGDSSLQVLDYFDADEVIRAYWISNSGDDDLLGV
jgi:hypothetical protein